MLPRRHPMVSLPPGRICNWDMSARANVVLGEQHGQGAGEGVGRV